MGPEQSVSDSPLALWLVYPCAKWSSLPSLPCWLQHISFLFDEYVSMPLLFPLTKLLQPRLSLRLCLFPSPIDNSATHVGQQSPVALTTSSHLQVVVPVFCICSPFALHWGGTAGSSSFLPMLGYQHHEAACPLHSQVLPGECSTDLFLVILLPVSSFLLVTSGKFYGLA